MKLILTIFLITFYTSVFSRISMDYQVKKDTFNHLVPEGKTRVYGTVLFNGKPVANARVSSLDHKRAAITDKEGKYNFLILSSDTSLYVYKPGKEEIVIDSYHFKSKHKVEIEFYLTYSITVPVAKPVIYLYSNMNQKVSMRLNVKGEITYTYPQYNNQWIVTTSKKGLKHKGTTYPYLFWEGESNTLNFVRNSKNKLEGFKVNSDSVTSFLENSLTRLGFNQKEKTDFITFWTPKIQKKKGEYFIQFLIDEDYKQYVAELEISPKPNSIRRVYMLYSFIDSQNKIEIYDQQELFGFKRERLTVFEWGGSEIKKIKNHYEN